MKIATADALLPSMCNGDIINDGIETLRIEKSNPINIEIIKGFFANLLTTFEKLFESFSFRLYNSSMVIEIETARIEIIAACRVAISSLSGKANVINGMPKNARLPNIVLKEIR